MDERQISALAYVIHTIRPAWEFEDIRDELRTNHKDFPTLAEDAIDAARTPELKHPAVLRTHRRPGRPLAPPKPTMTWNRCPKCHRENPPDVDCNCDQPKTIRSMAEAKAALAAEAS